MTTPTSGATISWSRLSCALTSGCVGWYPSESGPGRRQGVARQREPPASVERPPSKRGGGNDRSAA